MKIAVTQDEDMAVVTCTDGNAVTTFTFSQDDDDLVIEFEDNGEAVGTKRIDLTELWEENAQ